MIRLPFHYGWVVVATGTLCIFAGLAGAAAALSLMLKKPGEG
jgi:hypothetical protein